MSEELKVTQEDLQEVTQEDFELALHVINQFHKQLDQGWVLVNTGSIVVAKAAKSPLALEAALRHAYESLHGEMAANIYMQQQAAQGRAMEGAESTDGGQDPATK